MADEVKDVKDVTEDVIKSDNEKGNPYHKGKGSPDGGQFTSKDSAESAGVAGEKKLPSFLKKKGETTEEKPLPSFLKKKQPNENGGEQKRSRIDIIRERKKAPSLNHFVEYRTKRLERMREDGKFYAKVSPEVEKAINNKITELAKNSRLCSNVKLQYLESVLNKGLKNQFEVGSSGGAYSPEMRMETSHLLFGSDIIPTRIGGDWGGPKNPETFKYEKYGNLEASDLATAITNGSCSYYGNTKVFFKDYVRDRTTYSLNDSLNERKATQPGYLGSPADIGVWGGTNMYDGKKESLMRCKTLHEAANLMGSSADYNEAQIHGEIKPEDIAYIAFRYRHSLTTKDGIRAMKKADILGIPILFVDENNEVRRVTNASSLKEYGTYWDEIQSEPYEEQK